MIIITNDVDAPGMTRNIHIDVRMDGCIITMTSTTANSYSVEGKWAQIDDPEWMYEQFKYEYLVVFKGLAEMLSKIIDNKQTYLDLL